MGDLLGREIRRLYVTRYATRTDVFTKESQKTKNASPVSTQQHSFFVPSTIALTPSSRTTTAAAATMNAYNNAVDKIGAAIIDWSDPEGSFRADREVRDIKSLRSKKMQKIYISSF